MDRFAKLMLPAALCACLGSCAQLGQGVSNVGRVFTPEDRVRFRAAMVKGGLYFVLEEPVKISDVRVEISDKVANPPVIMWTAGCTENEYERCPKTAQLKYGQAGGAFATWTGPKTLQKDCEYTVRMSIYPGSFSAGAFTVLGDDTVSVPVPPSYGLVDISTITLEMNGVQTLIPYHIAVSSAGDRAIVTTQAANK